MRGVEPLRGRIRTPPLFQLSYTPVMSYPTMTVSTPYFALVDLCKNAFPRKSFSNHPGYAISLIPKMIEFKNNGITLSAVYARMTYQILFFE